MANKARKAPSAKKIAAARRNISKAHLARIRRREPRSIGRERRKRTPITLRLR